MPGIPVTKDQLNELVGTAARSIKEAIDAAEAAKYYLDAKTNAELLAELAISDAEASALKSAVADMAELAAIYRGQAALPNAKDFRTFMRRVWGLGVRSTSI